MGKTRNTGFSNNAIQYNSGSIAFVSGSTTLLNISSSGNIVTTGTITAQTLVIQTVTSSVSFVTGSTKFGSISANTHQFTGSMSVSGSGTFVGNITSNALTGTSTIIAEGLATSGEGLVSVRGKNSSGTSRRADFKYDNADVVRIATSSPINMQFETNDVVRLTISSSGNVGIGSSPSANAKFNVYNNTSDATYSVKIQGVFGNSDYLDSDANNNFGGGLSETQFLNGASNRPAMISLGGSLNTGEAMGVINFFRSGNTDGYRARAQFYGGVQTTGTANQHGGFLAFLTADDGQTNSQERMRITSGGVVYINASSNPLPSNAQPQFAVIGGAGTDAVAIKHTVDGNNTFNIWQTGTSQHNAIAFYKGDSQTNRGNIVVTTSGTSYNTISDYRLKENITPLENGLDRVLQLKPSKFNWIETGNESEGFIAHELQEYFPDAVTGEKDAVYSSTGNIKPQSVDYGRITPLLVKAIQELKAENDALKTRIETLENK
jgi:hypothetical protein